MTADIRALELAVVQAAIALRDGVRAGQDPVPLDDDLTGVVNRLIFACPECNQGGHVCPGDGNSIPHGAVACSDHDETQPEVEQADIWVLRTWADVRAGDTVRMPARPDTETDVYSAVATNWHVDPRSSEFQPESMDYTVVRVRFGDAGASLREMNPAAYVEILLSPATLLIIQTMGWATR